MAVLGHPYSSAPLIEGVLMMANNSAGPQRLNVRAVPGGMARSYGADAVALLGLGLLVEIDRAAFPSVCVGELLASRLAACGVPELVAHVHGRWPGLVTADESDVAVVEVLELVQDWADRLLGQAMTAARIGGDSNGLAA